MPAIPTDFQVQVRSHPRLLRPVRWLVRTWLNEMGVECDRGDEVVLALDEACTNAIRHSYHGEDGNTLVLTLRAAPEWLELELRDDGDPAPLEKMQARILEAPTLDRLQAGGLGVQLIHRVFDEVTFCPGIERGNCVIMRLRRGKG